MQNISKIIAGIALLTAAPVAMTALHLGTQAQSHQAPQYMASPVLASLGIASTPDHTVHGTGCGCAACQQGCQTIAPSTV